MAMKRKAGEPIQWAVDDGRFRPVGRTIRSLAPAIYEARSDMGGPYLHEQSPVSDQIIDSGSPVVHQVRSRVRTFVAAKEKYEAHGAVHKTGILLYGPAGTGKTVLIESLAREFVGAGGIVLRSSDIDTTIYVLHVIRQIEQQRLIVVTMEDIDEDVEDDERSLLALLDGQQQIDGIVFLATTNHISKLPKRIIRPSRFDLLAFVGLPSIDQRHAFLKAKATGMTETMIEAVAACTNGFSYAHLKEVVISVGCHGHEVIDAIERVRETLEPMDDDGPVTAPKSGAAVATAVATTDARSQSAMAGASR